MAGDQFNQASQAAKLEYATNKAIAAMWQAYDWRGTVSSLPPFWVAPLVQDYGAPFYSVPTDFLGIREAYLVCLNGVPPVKREIEVQKYIQETGLLGLPTRMCYLDAIQGFRLWPLPPTGAASPLYLIDGTYKKVPPRILRSNLGDTLLWQDLYFDTFVEACAWSALVCQGRRKEAMEQYAVFLHSLAVATNTDSLEQGEPAIHPTEGLGGYQQNQGIGFYY